MDIFNEIVNRTSKRKRIYKHIDKLLENRGINNIITLEIFPVNKCNLTCEFCSYKDIRNNEILPEKTMRNLIDTIIESDINGIVFSGGGEPTLHPYLPIAIKKLKKSNKDIGLITNASILSDNLLEAMSDCKWIRFSINAYTSEAYERITKMKQETFHILVKNIQEITNYVRNNEVVTGVSILIDSEDWKLKDFYNSIDFAKQIGVNQIFYKPLLNKFQRSPLNLSKYEKYYDDIIKKSNETNMVTNFKKILSQETNEYLEKKEGEECKFVRRQLVALVTALGDVYPCLYQYINHSFNSLGNIKEQSLKEIMSSNLLRNKEIIKNIDNMRCNYCKYSNLIKEIENYETTSNIEICQDIHNNFI